MSYLTLSGSLETGLCIEGERARKVNVIGIFQIDGSEIRVLSDVSVSIRHGDPIMSWICEQCSARLTEVFRKRFDLTAQHSNADIHIYEEAERILR